MLSSLNVISKDSYLGFFCNNQTRGELESFESVLDKDTAHPLGAVKNGVGRVVVVVPVWEVNGGGEELGFDDQ